MKPGYKMTEVGVVPEDWEVKTLGSFGQFKNGINKGSDAFGHGSPFVNLMDVFGVNSIKTCDGLGLVETTEAEQEIYDLKCGDVIFIRSSVKPSGVGLTAVVDADLPKTVYSGFLIRFRDGGTLDIDFKRHCFYSENFRNNLIAASTVSANTNINQDNLKKLFVALPSTNAEQHAIATALSDMDALLDGLDKLITKKRDLKQATMQQLLTGETRLSGFGGDWDVVEFGDIATIRNEKILCSSTPEGTPCVELEFIGQANGRLLGYIEATGASSKYSFKEGDVLFGRLRAYLRKHWRANFDGVCSTEIWPLIPRNERLYKGYLHLLVQMNSFVDAACVSYGTHMPRSDWAVLGKFEVQLPSVPEQVAISASLSDMDAELEALENRLEKTRQLKQAMMQELLTGKTRLI